MAQITIKNASVEFPIYNINARSLKKNFLRLATGGNVTSDQKDHVIVKALNNISLVLNNGDRVGLVGHNGAGKSTFLRLLAEIYEPSEGSISIQGHISPLLNITHGIETEFTGYENIMMRGIILGLTKKEINERTAQISDFSGLGDYLHIPLRTYSSGMLMRLAFAISTCIKPEILLIDEVFGAGDADFMVRAKSKMVSLLESSSIVVMASHSNDLIEEFCNKAILFQAGQIIAFDSVKTILSKYKELT